MPGATRRCYCAARGEHYFRNSFRAGADHLTDRCMRRGLSLAHRSAHAPPALQPFPNVPGPSPFLEDGPAGIIGRETTLTSTGGDDDGDVCDACGDGEYWTALGSSALRSGRTPAHTTCSRTLPRAPWQAVSSWVPRRLRMSGGLPAIGTRQAAISCLGRPFQVRPAAIIFLRGCIHQ